MGFRDRVEGEVQEQPPNHPSTHHWDEQVQARLQGLGEAAKPLDHTGGLLRDDPASQGGGWREACMG